MSRGLALLLAMFAAWVGLAALVFLIIAGVGVLMSTQPCPEVCTLELPHD